MGLNRLFINSNVVLAPILHNYLGNRLRAESSETHASPTTLNRNGFTMPNFKKLSLMLCILLPWSAAVPASSVLTFDGLFDDTDIQNEPIPTGANLAGFNLSSNWRVQSYAQGLVNSNSGHLTIPPNPDGSDNLFYLNNFLSPGKVAETLSITHSKPFYLRSLDLYTFPNSGDPVDDPNDADMFFSSARFVSVTGFFGESRGENSMRVADSGISLINDDNSIPGFPVHIQFQRIEPAWNQPVDRIELTLPRGQNLANPRFVLDNPAVTFVPAPPALILLGSALVGLAAARRRRRS